MKFGVIVAARTSSRRLPAKALLPVLSLPVIVLMLRRLKPSVLAQEIILATTTLAEDNVLAELAELEGVKVVRGPENDVLHRFVEGARLGNFDYAVRVTADCPFVSASTLDHVLAECQSIGEFDLVTTKPAYPHGIDYEVYPVRLLEEIDQYDLSAEDREHILNFVYRNEDLYQIHRLVPPEDLSCQDDIFLLDTPEDHQRMLSLCEGISDIHIKGSQLIQRYLQGVSHAR